MSVNSRELKFALFIIKFVKITGIILLSVITLGYFAVGYIFFKLGRNWDSIRVKWREVRKRWRR